MPSNLSKGRRRKAFDEGRRSAATEGAENPYDNPTLRRMWEARAYDAAGGGDRNADPAPRPRRDPRPADADQPARFRASRPPPVRPPAERAPVRRPRRAARPLKPVPQSRPAARHRPVRGATAPM